MSFRDPQLLWLLVLPAALFLATLFRRARAAAALPSPRIPRARLQDGALLAGSWVSSPRPAAASAALAALVLALARPQGATLSTPAVTQTRDVLVAVDVSRSMLADDVAPDRLSRARLLIRTLADELKGERLGLLPFAGTAFLQSPLSADYEIFRTFLDELGPDMIPAGGSDFTALLTAADEAFGPADATAADAPPPADRYLIILSDGEAQDETWKPLAQKLAGRGVRILALGLGTPAGALVPDGKGGIVKSPEGAAVLSKLDSSTLQELARVTDGAYRDASAWVDLPALLHATIARGRTTRTTTDTAPRREELFAWFLAPALLLLAFALVREFPVTPRARAIMPPPLPTRPPVNHTASFAVLLSLLCAFGLRHPARAADAPAEPPPDPLVELVGKLSSAADLAPADLARLAALTADQGEAARTAKKPSLPEGVLRDALAATDQGRASAPSAADWPALHSRLEALLAPPPEPPKPDPSQNQKDNAKNDPKKDSKNEDAKDKPSDSPQKSSGQDQQQQQDSQSSAQKDQNNPGNDPGSSQKPESSSGSGSPDKDQDAKSGSPENAPDKQPGKPSSQALGDLGRKPDEKPPQSDTPAPGADPSPPPEETQRAGGVSASGQPSKGEAGDSLAKLDPALAIPQQRLERVRDADAPARLYQLLQEAETPPDAARRAAGTPTRDW